MSVQASAYRFASCARLKEIRSSLGYNRAGFLRALYGREDIGKNVTEYKSLDHWEEKTLPPSVFVAIICARLGIDHNFIYNDQVGGLPANVYSKLLAYRREKQSAG